MRRGGSEALHHGDGGQHREQRGMAGEFGAGISACLRRRVVCGDGWAGGDFVVWPVGFGGSVGLESPMVSSGSAIGSNYGKTYHLNYKDRTMLLACGAAAAIAGAFNSPIAGVLFAIEVLLTDVSV